MTYRLYYWFRGAPENRLFGPWWYRDFPTSESLARFLRDVKPFLRAFAIVDGSHHPLEDHDSTRIRPPEDVTVITDEE